MYTNFLDNITVLPHRCMSVEVHFKNFSNALHVNVMSMNFLNKQQTVFLQY